jgi:hypothetical protein
VISDGGLQGFVSWPECGVVSLLSGECVLYTCKRLVESSKKGLSPGLLPGHFRV